MAEGFVFWWRRHRSAPVGGRAGTSRADILIPVVGTFPSAARQPSIIQQLFGQCYRGTRYREPSCSVSATEALGHCYRPLLVTATEALGIWNRAARSLLPRHSVTATDPPRSLLPRHSVSGTEMLRRDAQAPFDPATHEADVGTLGLCRSMASSYGFAGCRWPSGSNSTRLFVRFPRARGERFDPATLAFTSQRNGFQAQVRIGGDCLYTRNRLRINLGQLARGPAGKVGTMSCGL